MYHGNYEMKKEGNSTAFTAFHSYVISSDCNSSKMVFAPRKLNNIFGIMQSTFGLINFNCYPSFTVD